MRHALVRLTGLLIVLMLVLTGCNLIGVDPIMQLDEDFAKLKQKYSGVIATYDGGQVTQEDAMGSFTAQYSYLSQLYSMYGLNMTSDVVSNLEQSVAEEAAKSWPRSSPKPTSTTSRPMTPCTPTPRARPKRSA